MGGKEYQKTAEKQSRQNGEREYFPQRKTHRGEKDNGNWAWGGSTARSPDIKGAGCRKKKKNLDRKKMEGLRLKQQKMCQQTKNGT